MTIFAPRLTPLLALGLITVIPISTALTNIFLVLFLLSYVAQLQYDNYLKRFKTFIKLPIAQAVINFVMLYVLGATYGDASWSEIWLSIHKISKLLYIPLLMPFFAKPIMRHISLKCFVGVMCFTVVLGWLKLNGASWLNFSRFGGAAVFRDHIYTNFFMAFAAFIVAHWGMYQTKRIKILCLGLIFIFIYYIFFMSTGRSGYIIAFALIGVFGIQKFKLKGFILSNLALVMLMLIVYFYSSTFNMRFTQVYTAITHPATIETAENGIRERLQFAKTSWALFLEEPWFGSGTGSFSHRYEDYAKQHGFSPTRNPHNEFLNILVQFGISGIFSLFILIRTFYSESQLLPDFEKYMVQGLLIAMAIGCLANSWLTDFTSGYFMVFMCAIGFGASKPPSKVIAYL